jgi:hypothetical protein
MKDKSNLPMEAIYVNISHTIVGLSCVYFTGGCVSAASCCVCESYI